MAAYRTNNLYQAAAIIWATGIYPDSYSTPDDRGLVFVEWTNDEAIHETVEQYAARSLRVCPRGLSVIHINLKKKITTIKGQHNGEAIGN